MREVLASKSIMVVAALAFGCSLSASGRLFAQSSELPNLKPLQIPNRFTNLKVLPVDISRDRLITLMNQFAGQLGVRCSFCHEINSQTGRANFASDIKPEKQTARLMIRMTNAIDSKFLVQLPVQIKAREKVSCYTCHRGQPMPETESEQSTPPPGF